MEISDGAAAIARERGAVVIAGSVFDLRERERWNTALLLDGNIGIGGDPERLLARVAGLLRPGGSALVELEPPLAETRTLRLRLEGPSDVSDWIPWAWVGADAIEPLAATVGLRMDDLWSTRQRWFASSASRTHPLASLSEARRRSDWIPALIVAATVATVAVGLTAKLFGVYWGAPAQPLTLILRPALSGWALAGVFVLGAALLAARRLLALAGRIGLVRPGPVRPDPGLAPGAQRGPRRPARPLRGLRRSTRWARGGPSTCRRWAS